MPDRRALIVAAGADVDAVRGAEPVDLVICADGGLDVTIAAGRRASLVIGDLDSVSDEALAAATAAGTDIERHRIDKDESDLELALAAALDRSATELHVHLGEGGRLDHQLANLLVLASPRWDAADLSAVVGTDRVWVVRGRRELPLAVGAPVAVHAIGGIATGVRTRGLAFEMDGEDLEPMVARGIANRAVEPSPSISVESGVVLVISSPRP